MQGPQFRGAFVPFLQGPSACTVFYVETAFAVFKICIVLVGVDSTRSRIIDLQLFEVVRVSPGSRDEHRVAPCLRQILKKQDVVIWRNRIDEHLVREKMGGKS